MGLAKGIVKLFGKLIKMLLSISFTVILIAVGVYIYARYIEPELLIVKEEKIMTQSIATRTEGIRIVQFSDLHLGEDYSTAHLQKVVNQINKLEPDLVIFTGDLIDDNKTFNETQLTIKGLSEIKATIGKYAVFGNHDHGGNGTRRYQKIMKEAGFILLKNQSHRVEISKGKYINIMGLDDALLGKMNIKESVKGIQEQDFNLFISHAPDVADQVLSYPIDLQISGHSHGGQVSIPLLGPPFTPPLGSKYIAGKYTFAQNERMLLYVNTGIGTSQLRYRLGNIPEITLFIVTNK